MIHRILTCKNHPNLRWSCKEIAWTETADGGYYNGMRSIFFNGETTGEMYADQSGVRCNRMNENGYVAECTCSVKDLMIAPEDEGVKRT